jgi:hypothetical protein
VTSALTGTVTVKTVQEFKLALLGSSGDGTGGFIRALCDRSVMDKIGYLAKHIIEDRTVNQNLNAEGYVFPMYNTNPIYVSLNDRPKPRGGEPTPRPRVRGGSVGFDIYSFTSKVRKPRKQKRKWVVDYNPYTFSGGRHLARGKSMYFPGGYRQYKANIYGPNRNLTKSGLMFSNLLYKASDKTVLLYFAGDGPNDRATGNDERTPFFRVGLIPEEAQLIQKTWEEALRGK